jgi:hypothetical protein
MRRTAFTPEEAADVGEAIGIRWDDVAFTPEDLAAGMDVELEHGTKMDERVNVTDDALGATAQIAWAHLMEDPDYYVMLDAMEQEFDGERTPELRNAIAMPHYRDNVVMTDDYGYEETYDTARAAAHGSLEWFMMFYNDLEADLTDAERDAVLAIINSFAVREIHTTTELASEFRSLKRRIIKALGPAWDLVYAPWIRVHPNTEAHRNATSKFRPAAKIDFTTVDLDDIAEYRMAQNLGRQLDDLSHHYVGDNGLLDWSSKKDINALLDNLYTLEDKTKVLIEHTRELNHVLRRYLYRI